MSREEEIKQQIQEHRLSISQLEHELEAIDEVAEGEKDLTVPMEEEEEEVTEPIEEDEQEDSEDNGESSHDDRSEHTEDRQSSEENPEQEEPTSEGVQHIAIDDNSRSNGKSRSNSSFHWARGGK